MLKGHLATIMDVTKTHDVVEMSCRTLFTRLQAYRVALFWFFIFVCSNSDDVGDPSIFSGCDLSVLEFIQFAYSVRRRSPWVVILKVRENQVAFSHIVLSHIFSDVVMSEGIEGMTTAIFWDNSRDRQSKMIQSNYTLVASCVFSHVCCAPGQS